MNEQQEKKTTLGEPMYGSIWNKFWQYETPTLTESFAGIGSRLLTPQGIQAIKDVYKKTFKS